MAAAATPAIVSNMCRRVSRIPASRDVSVGRAPSYIRVPENAQCDAMLSSSQSRRRPRTHFVKEGSSLSEDAKSQARLIQGIHLVLVRTIEDSRRTSGRERRSDWRMEEQQ